MVVTFFIKSILLHSAVKSVCRFLVSMHREEDVSETMYPDSFHSPSAHDEVLGTRSLSPKGTGKVDLVCTAVREVLVGKGENHYLLSIITSYIKMSRPDLESVLTMIQKLKGQGSI